MKRLLYIFLIAMAAWWATPGKVAAQQIHGIITDTITGEPIPYITVQYEGKGVGSISNDEGEYFIPLHANWREVTFSAVGYVTKKVRIDANTRQLDVKMRSTDVMLTEVVVKPKREKYSRKNNPAVEFMKKVLAHKKDMQLESNDYYRYKKYEKIKISLNDISKAQMESKAFKKYRFLADQVEISNRTGKQIIPISIKETVSEVLYQKSPEKRKTYIEGATSSGVDEFFNTGDMVGVVMTEVFCDVNIFDNDIKLLGSRFVSPIGTGCITFYKYYIMDTLKIDGNPCVHLTFVPQNSQDFGFSGHLYVMQDSTYAIKSCRMNLPKKTGVNFVESLDIYQKFEKSDSNSWLLTDDDMTVEIAPFKGAQSMEVERITKYSDYSFAAIDEQRFKGKGEVIKNPDMMSKDDKYWAEVRQVPLTQKESGMQHFVERITKEVPGFKYLIFGAKALIENFVETGGMKHKSKFDFGPINTAITSNYVNGLRFRLSGLTTGYFSPHVFLSGYGAYGTKDKKWFYSGQVAYSFNKREYMLWEYPMHYIAFKAQYDVMSASDRFLHTDKDNMFAGFKWTTVDQMSYIRDLSLTYQYESNTGFSVKAVASHKKDEPCGNLYYFLNDGSVAGEYDTNTQIKDLTTTEVALTLRYAPGESFVNSKQRRVPISYDAPVLTLSHTMGMKILGGDYKYNVTEASLHKRFWFGSWGYFDADLKAGAQWNKVPFPLLNIPQANLSYLLSFSTKTYSLMNNMEFLNDRYLQWHLRYNACGKFFNRIPLLRKLKWRETFRVSGLWGTLTDKNNPYVEGNTDLYLFPMRDGVATSHVMDKKTPYIEAAFGIYNIFKLLHVEYVRRLTYTDYPGVHKSGIRFAVLVQF